jgi:phage gp46-like protein
MENVLDFITTHYQAIVAILVFVVGVVLIGRKRGLEMVATLAEEFKDEILDGIGEKEDAYAKYIHSKLPKRAKIFISIGIVKKAINKFIEEARKVDLDNK